MKTILSVAILCAFLSPAYARIGETRAECEKRYGKAVSVSTNDVRVKAEYTNSGYTIKVEFPPNEPEASAKAEWIAISMQAANPAGGKPSRFAPIPALSSNAVEILLAANSGGRRWKPVLTNEKIIDGRKVHMMMKDDWRTEDGVLTARAPRNQWVEVFLSDRENRMEQRQKAAEQKRGKAQVDGLRGF